MNQSEDDDHSGGQEEARGSRLCCDAVNNVVMVITGYHSDKESSKDYSIS